MEIEVTEPHLARSLCTYRTPSDSFVDVGWKLTDSGTDAQLARFQGRPGDLSPKARIHLWLSKLFPESYSSEPPFDRHDWIVTRPVLDASGQAARDAAGKRIETEQRYVIDYYSGGLDADGFPVFSLDVRPALDNFTALSERVRVAVEEWKSQSGNDSQ